MTRSNQASASASRATVVVQRQFRLRREADPMLIAVMTPAPGTFFYFPDPAGRSLFQMSREMRQTPSVPR